MMELEVMNVKITYINMIILLSHFEIFAFRTPLVSLIGENKQISDERQWME